MGFTYKFANVEPAVGGGLTGRAYALVDTGATVTALSEEVASSSGLRGNRRMQMRGFRREVLGAWISEASVEILGTKLPLKVPVLIVPRGVLEEDAIIGRDFVQQMLGKVDIRVFPTPNGMTCEACGSVITECRCVMKPIAGVAPQPVAQQPPGPGGPAGPSQPSGDQTGPGARSPGAWGPNPTRSDTPVTGVKPGPVPCRASIAQRLSSPGALLT